MEENYEPAVSKKKITLAKESTTATKNSMKKGEENHKQTKKKKRSSNKKKKKKSKDKSKKLSNVKLVSSDCKQNINKVSQDNEEFLKNLSEKLSLTQNNQSIEINFNDSETTKKHKQSNLKLESHQKHLNSEQECQDHFNKILHEVKKILKKDISGKRKLKYIFKKHKANIPCVKLRSFSEDKSYTSENEQKKEDDEHQLELNTLKNLQSGLAAKARKSLSKKLTEEVNAITKHNENLENRINFLIEKSPLYISSITEEPKIISRTPSPALPILKDNAVFNQEINEKIHQVSLIRKINLLEELPELNLKTGNSLKCNSNEAKYLTIDSHFLNTSTAPCKPHIFLANSSPSKNFEITNSLNKNNINIEKTFSLYQLSSDPLSKSYSQCLTPIKISSPKQWSPVFLLQNNSLDQSLKKDLSLAKNDNDLINPIQSSSVTTSSESKSPSDKTSQVKNFSVAESNKCENGSLISSKKSKSPSSTISQKSEDKPIRRSGSQNSIHTFSSSSRYSRSSCSHSSRSSSPSPKRQSSPVSSKSSRSRSPSIPRRHGSPSFLDRRRITSARKKPIPYRRSTPSPSYSSSPSDRESNDCSSWSSRSRRSSQSSVYSPTYLFAQCSDF